MKNDTGDKLPVSAVRGDGLRRFDRALKERVVAACLKRGASVSRVALEHGVDLNLVWKWIHEHRLAREEEQRRSELSRPAFIRADVDAARHEDALWRSSALDLHANGRDARPAAILENSADQLSLPTKVKASLPNGVMLTLECCDVRAVTAIIEALGRCHVPA